MTWVRMDDQWPFNRKLLHVEPTERLMWAMSIAYASSQNTDGVIDVPMARMLAFMAGCQDATEAAEKLVKAGLWDAYEDGRWSVHDYLDFNFSAAERRDLSDQRAAAGRRGGMARASNGQASAQANAKQVLSELPSNGQANGKRVAKQTSSNVPSRPVPSYKTTSSSSTHASETPTERTDDDDDLVLRTINELGRRDHERAVADGVAVRNRQAHLAACVTQRQDAATAIAALIAANPAWPPERLADEIEDPGGSDRRAGKERALRALGGS